MLDQYDGFEWGWMLQGGTREEKGRGAYSGTGSNIIGMWGRTYRKDIKKPFYVETFMCECQPDNPTGSWAKRPLSNLFDVNMSKCLRLAYPESLPIANEMLPLPEPETIDTREVLLWHCQACGHEFYTETGAKMTARQAISKLIAGPKAWKRKRIPCQVCTRQQAKKIRKEIKEIR